MKKVLFALIIFFLLIGIGAFAYYNIMISPVSDEKKVVQFEVSKNMAYSLLADKLYEDGLIRSKFIYKVYIKLNKPERLEVGIYSLNTSMSLKEIINALSNGVTSNQDEVKLTIREGLNMRKVALAIERTTEGYIKYDEVIDVAEDREFAKSLIDKYWFLSDEILDPKIYYPLEGYLFPDTYQILKTYEVKKIFTIMLDQMDSKLSKYKDDLKDKNIHDLLTMASLVELEGKTKSDRENIADVFYKRIELGETLGSDVTTYYGSKVDDFSTKLYQSQLDDCTNGYNTRGFCRKGLPVGPISTVGTISIEAALYPGTNNYLFFVADCYGKIYFSKTQSEFTSIRNKLMKENNWCA